VITILLTHGIATSIGYFNLSRTTFADGKREGAWVRYQLFYIIPLLSNLMFVPTVVVVWSVNPYLAQGSFTLFYAVFAYFYHLIVTFKTLN